MFTDFSVNCGPVFEIIFVFERVPIFPRWPIVTKSESDDGIARKSRELHKYDRHTYSDSGICINNAIICTQKV